MQYFELLLSKWMDHFENNLFRRIYVHLTVLYTLQVKIINSLQFVKRRKVCVSPDTVYFQCVMYFKSCIMMLLCFVLVYAALHFHLLNSVFKLCVRLKFNKTVQARQYYYNSYCNRRTINYTELILLRSIVCNNRKLKGENSITDSWERNNEHGNLAGVMILQQRAEQGSGL